MHFLAELTTTVREQTGRPVLFVAEDHRNLAQMLRPVAEGGWGIDAVWADDFHHQARVHVAHDREGYYADFTGSAEDLATTLRQGWFFSGQHSTFLGRPRGSDPSGLSPKQFVVCIQNHDQIGNRAHGARLNHEVDEATFRALSTLLLLAAADAAAVHGPGVGGLLAVSVLHRSRRGSRAQGHRRAAPGVQRVRRLCRSRPPRRDSRPAGSRDVRAQPPAVGRGRARSARPGAPALSTVARSPPRDRAIRTASRRALRRARARRALADADASVRRRAWRPRSHRDRAALRRRRGAVPGAGPTWRSLVITTEDADVTTDPPPIRVDTAAPFTVHFARPGAIVFRGLGFAA